MSTKSSPLTKALVGALLIHAVAYFLVNGFLFLINLATTLLLPPWFLGPLVGWGVGLAIHAAATLCVTGPRQIGKFFLEAELAVPALAPLVRPVQEALGRKSIS